MSSPSGEYTLSSDTFDSLPNPFSSTSVPPDSTLFASGGAFRHQLVSETPSYSRLGLSNTPLENLDISVLLKNSQVRKLFEDYQDSNRQLIQALEENQKLREKNQDLQSLADRNENQLM